jgi:hypothetical protein
MEQLRSLRLFVQGVLTEKSFSPESIANVTINEHNNLQYRLKLFMSYKFYILLHTHKHVKSVHTIRCEYLDPLQRK